MFISAHISHPTPQTKHKPSKRFLLSTFCLSMLTAGMVITPAHAAEQSPPEFVKTISDNLIKRLVDEKAAYQKDPSVLVKIVEDNIEPYVDFKGFSKGVMGRYYRGATDAQKQTFEKKFRSSLISAYAKYLGEFDNQSYRIRPYVANKDPKKAIITMDFKTGGGDTVPISYQLVDQGQWKVRNVKVAGIDIGLTFRKQFGATVQENRNNLDQAIANFIPQARKK